MANINLTLEELQRAHACIGSRAADCQAQLTEMDYNECADQGLATALRHELGIYDSILDKIRDAEATANREREAELRRVLII